MGSSRVHVLADLLLSPPAGQMHPGEKQTWFCTVFCTAAKRLPYRVIPNSVHKPASDSPVAQRYQRPAVERAAAAVSSPAAAPAD